jgi:hypothetical protein
MPDVQRLVGVPKAKAGNGTKQSVVGLAGTGNSGIAYRFGQIIAVGVVLAFIGAFLATGGLKPSGETQGGAQQTLGPGGGGVTKNLTGAFVSWEAVSDSAGYMHFTVTNNGTTSERATCTIQVQDDFGDFGFDYMTGTVVAPGQTISLRAPLNVG